MLQSMGPQSQTQPGNQTVATRMESGRGAVMGQASSLNREDGKVILGRGHCTDIG